MPCASKAQIFLTKKDFFFVNLVSPSSSSHGVLGSLRDEWMDADFFLSRENCPNFLHPLPQLDGFCSSVLSFFLSFFPLSCACQTVCCVQFLAPVQKDEWLFLFLSLSPTDEGEENAHLLINVDERARGGKTAAICLFSDGSSDPRRTDEAPTFICFPHEKEDPTYKVRKFNPTTGRGYDMTPTARD